jgi:hypothetical protein
MEPERFDDRGVIDQCVEPRRIVGPAANAASFAHSDANDRSVSLRARAAAEGNPD